MKFLLIENGSYSNPDYSFFSRCSRRFLTDRSVADLLARYLRSFAAVVFPARVRKLCDACALAVKRRRGIVDMESLAHQALRRPRPL